MRGRRGGRWTILLLRPGDTETRALRLGRGALLLSAGLAVLLSILIGVGIGRAWAGLVESPRVRALEGEVARLEADRSRMDELAGRLEGIEAWYRRVRRTMGGEVVPSGRDVLLPPLAGEEASAPDAGDAGARDDPGGWPVVQKGFVTRSFGASPAAAGPRQADDLDHPGLDIAVPVGSYVRAAGAGVVVEAGEDAVYGHFVRIAHRRGLSSLYAHNSWIFVGRGDTVERYQVIALSGNTGRSTAPHLHFEIARNGEAVDPFDFVSLGR